MSVRARDPQGDWTMGRGRGSLLTGNNAIAQQISDNVMAIVGDCFFDLAKGIDWFNLLGSKLYADLDLQIRTAILNTSGVTGLIEVSTNLDEDRLVTTSFNVTTVFSDEPLKGVLGFLVDNLGNVLVTDGGDQIHA